MPHTTQYKLTDANRQRRMEEFAEADEPAELSAELAAARLMVEESMNAGHLHLAAVLLQSIAKLSSATIEQKARLGELLEKRAVMELGRELVTLVTNVIKDRFVGWEMAIDQLADQITTTVEEKKNEDKKPLLLEGPKMT